MGQLSGKAQIPRTSAFFPYLSLSFHLLQRFWEAFNHEAEGFALPLETFSSILSNPSSDANANANAKALFLLFDSDQNGLVDALEVFSTLALCSAAPLREKLLFILSAYDFDADQRLSIDELALLLKCAANGLCKVCATTTPPPAVVERAAELIFRLCRADLSQPLSTEQIYLTLRLSVEVSSWVDYFHLSFLPPPQQMFFSVSAEGSSGEVAPPPALAKRYYGGEGAWYRQALELAPSGVEAIEADCEEEDLPAATLGLSQVLCYATCPAPCFLAPSTVLLATSAVVSVVGVRNTGTAYFMQHQEEVAALAAHEGRAVAASGGKGELFVWEAPEVAQGVRLLRVLQVPEGRVVKAVGFDEDGGRLACAAVGDGRTDVLLFEWETDAVPVWSAAVPHELDILRWVGPHLFVAMQTPCVSPLVFAQDYPSASWSVHQGIRDSDSLLASLTVAPQDDQDIPRFLCGTEDGYLLEWVGWHETRKWLLSKGTAVRSIDCSLGRLLTAGDGTGFRLYEKQDKDSKYEEIHRCNPAFKDVRSVRLFPDKCSALISTAEGVYVWNLFDTPEQAEKVAVRVNGRLRACCASPRNNNVVCAADETHTYIWDFSRGLGPVLSHPIQAVPICCEMSFCGTILAIGTSAPKAQLLLLNVDSEAVSEICALAEEPMDSVTCMAFTPDKLSLIVGFSSGVVRACSVRDMRAGSKRIKWKAEGFVPNGLLTLDVSADSTFCITNTSDDEGIHALYCEDLENVEMLSEVKDVNWHTKSCLFGWTTLADTAKSWSCMAVRDTLAARGDNEGRLVLQPYPLTNDWRRLGYKWSSAEVTKAVFSKDGDALFAIDAKGSLLKWRVEKTATIRGKGEVETQSKQHVGVLTEDIKWVEGAVKPRRPPKRKQVTPSRTLVVRRVYGCSLHTELRRHARYILDNKALEEEVVFPAGAILLGRSGGSERVLTGAKGSITSVEVNSTRRLVAVGDASGLVRVMESTGLEDKAKLHLQDPVLLLRFSQDETVLGIATRHTIELWTWQLGLLTTVCASKPLSMAFCNGAAKDLLCCGKGYVRVYTINGRNATRIKNLNIGDVEPTCVAHLPNERIAVGTAAGRIVFFSSEETASGSSLNAHHGAVNGIEVLTRSIVSFGADGIIKLWSAASGDLDLVQTIDMAQHVPTDGTAPGITSVAMDGEGHKLLCATIFGQIVEVRLEDGRPDPSEIVEERLPRKFKCAAALKGGGFYIISSIGAVMKLEGSALTKLWQISCESKILCMALPSEQDTIAVGTHTVLVFTLEGRQIYAGEAGDPVSCLKFSEAKNYLAAGRGRKVTLFDYKANGAMAECQMKALHKIVLAQVCRGLEFSVDAKYIGTLHKGQELQWWECPKGEEVRERGRLSKIELVEGHSLPAEWALQGLFRSGAKIITSLQVCKTLGCVVVGYKAGSVAFHPYPCLDLPISGAFESIPVGSESIRDVKLSHDLSSLLVVTAESLVELEILDCIHAHRPHNQRLEQVPLCQMPLPVAPSTTARIREPVHTVDLRGYDCRGAFQVASSGKLIYMGALRCGISRPHGIDTRVFSSTSLVMGIGLSLDRRMACTVHKSGEVCIWDANTGSLVNSGSVDMELCTCVKVAFALDGKALCVLSSRTEAASSGTVLGIEVGREMVQQEYILLDDVMYWMVLWTCRNELVFCTSGEMVVWRRGVKKTKETEVGHTCGVIFGDQTVLGDDQGGLSLWDDLLQKPVQTQESNDPVLCLAASEDVVVSGHMKGVLRLWGANLVPVTACSPSIDLSMQRVSPKLPPVMSVGIQEMGIIAACQSGEVLRVCPRSGSIHPVMSFHSFYGEACALDTHPTEAVFATAGDDGMLRVWTLSQSLKQSSSAALHAPIRALAYSPDGLLIGIGFGRPAEGVPRDALLREEGRKTGGFAVVSSVSLEVLFQGRDSKKWVRCCRFSPSGAILAVGGEDHNAHIYDCKNGFKRLFSFKAHKQPIHALDFDLQSNFLRSQSIDGKIHVHGCLDGRETDAEEAFTWVRTRCVEDGAECTDREGDVRVSGYADGIVTVVKGSQKESFLAHYGRVCCIRVLNDVVVSLGGVDRSICIWKIDG